MGKTVSELLSSISSYELAEWAEYYILEAEDERRAMDAAKRGQKNDDDDDAEDEDG